MPKQFYKNALVNNSRTNRRQTSEQMSYHCVFALFRTPMRFIGMIAHLHYLQKILPANCINFDLDQSRLTPIQLWEKISSLADR
jgi:hypothetical protein